jgi:hypothetical protein
LQDLHRYLTYTSMTGPCKASEGEVTRLLPATHHDERHTAVDVGSHPLVATNASKRAPELHAESRDAACEIV